MFLVVGDVAIKFGLPPFGAGFRRSGSFASFMPVPEAAVDEDDGLVFAQDDIGLAGKVLAMEAEAVAGAVEHGTDEQFGLGILALDRGHIPRAFL